MGIAIGHRNVLPLKLGHRHGLNKIKPRHGIPFYNPAEVYRRGNLISNPLIIFSLTGITGGSLPVKSNISADVLFRFMVYAIIDSTYEYVMPEDAGKINGGATFYFYVKGLSDAQKRLAGNAQISFYTILGIRKLSAQALITFYTEGALNTSILTASTTITFTTEGTTAGESSPVNLRGSALIQFSTQAVLSGVADINYGFLYNWYAVAGIA